MYPTIAQSDIKRILQYGWKAFYLHNSYGGDVLVNQGKLWFYSGYLMKDSLRWFEYYQHKMRTKLRVMYKRKKIKWDGYYYFALSDSQYKAYQEQQNKRGRPRKYFNFGTVFLYQILDECKINEHYKRYIFKIPIITLLKQKQFVKQLISDSAQLILTREPLKFKDILIYDNEYEFL